MHGRRKPEELDEEERQALHRAHQRLRNASHALEALTVIEKMRARWPANPAPPEALDAAADELHRAIQELWRAQRDLLAWEPPAGAMSG